MKVVDKVGTIRAMKLQEANYLCKDYLQVWHNLDENLCCDSRSSLDPNLPVDRECRFRMAGWCYQVVDFCEFNRDTVAISMNYLDRFMSTDEGMKARKDLKLFQLAGMACLYTAIKVHEQQALEPKVISELSRGIYTEKQITDMERQILESIEWRMNPPTPLSFIQSFLYIIPDYAKKGLDHEAVTEIAKYQSQLAVVDSYFLSCSPSSIAIAAIANAAKGIRSTRLCEPLQLISKAFGIDMNSQDFMNCCDRLWNALHDLPQSLSSKLIPQSSTVSKAIGSIITGADRSPRGVTSYISR